MLADLRRLSFASLRIHRSPKFLRFGSGNNKKDNGKLPLPGVGDVVIFPYLDNLVLPNAAFSLRYTFTNSMVKFEWQGVPYGIQSPSAYMHFELEYLVGTPNILYVRYFHDSNPAFLNGESATIGVQSRMCPSFIYIAREIL